ncbi:MAG: hypothetical protein ACFE8E_14230 [Candidatus Hodarchaeota archaeon]
MIDNIIRIYKIGKELGLTKREITTQFFVKKTKYQILSMVILILLIIISVISVSVLIGYAYLDIERNTYPSGARYSTVKLKDFRLRGKKLSIKRKS